MCAPETISTVRKNLQNRRDLLTAAATATAALALSVRNSEADGPKTPKRRIVDLTHPLTPDFPTYAGVSTFGIEKISKFGEVGWNQNRWTLHEHTGTHLDAPVHRSADGAAADQIDPSEFVLPLVVVDIRARAAENSDAEVTPDDLKKWESKNGRIPRGACVAMNSGWDQHVKTKRFRNADDKGAMHFPGFHEESAAFLLKERAALALAVDTLSIDIGPTKSFPTHTRWLPAGRWAIECVANLDKVPLKGADLFVGMPKIAGATGGPCRVLAMV